MVQIQHLVRESRLNELIEEFKAGRTPTLDYEEGQSAFTIFMGVLIAITGVYLLLSTLMLPSDQKPKQE